MLFVAIRHPFYEGKTASLEKIVQFAKGEQKRFDLAQILEHKRARLRFWSPGFFATHTPFAG